MSRKVRTEHRNPYSIGCTGKLRTDAATLRTTGAHIATVLVEKLVSLVDFLAVNVTLRDAGELRAGHALRCTRAGVAAIGVLECIADRVVFAADITARYAGELCTDRSLRRTRAGVAAVGVLELVADSVDLVTHGTAAPADGNLVAAAIPMAGASVVAIAASGGLASAVATALTAPRHVAFTNGPALARLLVGILRVSGVGS